MNKTEIVIAYPIKFLTLDPHRMEEIFSMTINNQVNASLLRYLNDGEIEASIAKSWSVSSDGLTYILKLDKKTFSNGEAITTKDVINSLKRVFIKEASIAVDLSSIKGVSKYKMTKNHNDIEISENAPGEIKIVLEKPNSVLLKQLATPDTAILKLDDNFEINQSHISSGKYKIIKENKGELTLEFWNPDDLSSASPPNIIHVLLLEKDNRVDMALEGKLDIIGLNNTMEKELETLKKNGWKETLGGLSQENFLILSPQKVPLVWRQYFFQQFSTDELLKNLNFSNKAAAYGYVPTALQGSIKAPFPQPTTLVKESELPPLTLEISYTYFSGIEEIFNHFKTNWVHPKLTIKTTELKVDVYMDLVYGRKLQAYTVTKGLDYPDAMANLSYFKSDLKENFFLIEDKAIDKKLSECATSSNKKDTCFTEIQKMIYDKNIVLPLYYGSNKSEYYSNKIKSFPPHPLGQQFMSFDHIEMR